MTVESLLFHLTCLENESAEFYARMARHTVSMPKVRTLFTRLSEEETSHRDLVKMAREYQTQATGQINLKLNHIDTINQARQFLTEMSVKTEEQSPQPPFLDLLQDVLNFEKDMEARHYSTYLDISDESLKELLLQLTRYDKNHVSMISQLIDQLSQKQQEDPAE